MNDSGEHPPEGEEFELRSFGTDEYRVEFTLSETASPPGFLLICDEDPCFDGQPEPLGGRAIWVLRYEAG